MLQDPVAWSGPRADAGRSYPTAGHVRPRLIGRDADLQRLVSALMSLPAVVVIEGEAGIGKTRLASAVATDRLLGDRRFIVGGCLSIGESFPLGPFLEALRAHRGALAADLLSPVAGALRALLPELADVLPAAPEPLGDADAERHRVFRGLVEVLGSLGPSVLVIEDLHWADQQTVDFLKYLLTDPPDWLALVLTFRGDEVHPAVRTVTARLPESVARASAALGPLPVDEVRILVAATLGADRISEELAHYLWQRSSGLPFVVLELLALLQERGQLTRMDGRWVRRTLDELDVPAGVADPVRARVAGLSPAARAVVEGAAVLLAPVPLATLLSLHGVAEVEAREGLGEAVAAGLLVEQSDGLVGFRHVLAAQAVYEKLGGLRRQDLHRWAAAAVSSLDPVPLGQLAHHLRHSGMTSEWVAAAEAAAAHAVQLGHYAEAARFWDDLLRHAPLAAATIGRVAVNLALWAMYAPRVREMTDLLIKTLQRDLPLAVRGELRFRVAQLMMNVGSDSQLAYQFYRDAVADLSQRPDLRARAMLELGMVHGATVAVTEHRRWLSRALDDLPELGDQPAQLQSHYSAAVALLMAGDHRWRKVTERINDRIGNIARHRLEVVAYYSIGNVASHSGHHETAETLLGAGLASPVIAEIVLLRLALRCAHADLDYYCGAWAGLRQRVDDLLDELSGVSLTYHDVQTVAACLRLAAGELDKSRRSLLSVVHSCEESGHLGFLPLPVAALGRLASTRDDPEAITAVDRFVALVTSKGAWPMVLRALPSVTSALVFTERVAEANDFLSRVEDGLRGLDAPLAAAAVPHARGFLDLAERRWPDAARSHLTAAAHYEALRCPYEAAQVREQAAAALFATSDPLAQRTLQEAMQTYRRLEARWDLERAGNLARRHGMSLPARHRGGPRGYGIRLSPREREVAALVATGRTNREIAADLYLSAKTVEKHLSAALRKLGLRSRTALARHADVEGDGVAELGDFPHR